MILAIACSLIFVAGYVLITLEHRFGLHKALPAAALGAGLWILIGIFEGGEGLTHALDEVGAEIFGLIIFLMAAMTLVEILTHYRFFDLIRVKIYSLGLTDVKQLWVIGAVAFFLSAIIDNLTATLVMLAISTRFFGGGNLLRAAAIVVISANAGGAWSPIGDVTTIMLWLADKFTALEVITWGFLPSIALFFVSTYMLTRNVTQDTKDKKEEKVTLTLSEKFIIGTALGSFLLPFFVSRIGLEPYFGLIFGVGLVGLMIAFFSLQAKKKEKISGQTHLTANLEEQLSRIDLASLIFFTGILLAVGALEHLGILDFISHTLLGEAPSLARLIFGNSMLGVLSAIMDNIPLTAAAIDILHTTDPAIWVLLALTVGTGGSLLVIGSAAGVVAMGKVKELNFFRYIKIATLPAASGYAVAILVWVAQYLIFA